MSWTNDEVLEFIDLYRQEQHLWDPKDPLYKTRNEITNAWLRIQTSLSRTCSVVELKRKKESIMTSFRFHWNKKKRSQYTYEPSWFAYSLMESFLGEKYECDSTIAENEFFSDGETYIPHTPGSDLNTSRHITDCNTVNKQRQKRAVSHTNKESINPYERQAMKNTYGDKNEDDKTEMDEYDLFGQLLAKKLRKLEEPQRDVAMHEIDNIMFRVKMDGASVKLRSFTSSPSSPTSRKIKSPVFIVTQATNHSQYEDENIGYQVQHSL